MILIAPAHVTLDYKKGSEALSVYLILKTLHRLGIPYIALVGSKPKYVDLPKYKTIEIGKTQSLIEFHIKAQYTTLRTLSRVSRPVILHHMLPFSFYHGVNLCIVFRSARKIGGALIGPITYPVTRPYIDELIIAGLKSSIIMHSVTSPRNPLLNWLHKLTLHNANVILFDSMKTLKLFKSIYGNLAEYDVLYLPIDVDNIPFKPAILKNEKPIVIASIGGLRFIKRHDLFIMLVKYLRTQEKMNVKGYIIGWGPLKDYLSKLIEKLGLKDIVEIRSFKRREDMIRFVAKNVDVVVSFSISEGLLPTSIREAMAMGKIVLMRNVGAADEFIVNGTNGFIFNDFWEALDIIRRLNSKDARRIAVNARQLVEKVFSPIVNAKRLVRIYESIDPKAVD